MSVLMITDVAYANSGKMESVVKNVEEGDHSVKGNVIELLLISLLCEGHVTH